MRFLLLAALTAALAFAQSFQVGAVIDYPGVRGWEQGPITQIDQNNRMVRVRQTDGYEGWFGFAAVRPATQATRMPQLAPFPGAGLVTKEQIVQYINTYGMVNGHYSQSQPVCKAVTDAVMTRGAGFKWSYFGVEAISSASCIAGAWPIPSAVLLNQGPPKQLGWLMGNWTVSVIAPTVDRLHYDGWVYRREEFGAQAGLLQVSGNGTYTWQQRPGDPPAAYVHGRWRLSAAEEMGLQGGAGIVLLRGEAGADWIVYPWWGAPNQDMIEIENLVGRGGQRRLALRR